MGRRKAIEMTPAQKQIFLVIDEWWRNYGYGPTVKEIMMITGEKGEGNVHRKMKALIDLGICRGVPRRARSIRPVGLKVRSIE